MLRWNFFLLACCGLMCLQVSEPLPSASLLSSSSSSSSSQGSRRLDSRVESPGNLTDVWVATNGSDSSGDGSMVSPFLSLQRAVATPWDRLQVWLMSGRFPAANNSKLQIGAGRVTVLRAEEGKEVELDLAHSGPFLSADTGASIYLIGLRILRASLPTANISSFLPSSSPFFVGSFLTALNTTTVVIDGCQVADCVPPVFLSRNSDCQIIDSFFLNHSVAQKSSQPASFFSATDDYGHSIFALLNTSFSDASIFISESEPPFEGAVFLSGFLSVDISGSAFSNISVTITDESAQCYGALSVSNTADFTAFACLFLNNSIAAPSLSAFPVIQGASLSLTDVSSASLSNTSFVSSSLIGYALTYRGAALNAKNVRSLKLLDCAFVDSSIQAFTSANPSLAIHGAAVGAVDTAISAERCLFDRPLVRLHFLSEPGPTPFNIMGGVFSTSVALGSTRTASIASCLFR